MCGKIAGNIGIVCKRRKVKPTDDQAEFGDRLDSLLPPGAQTGYSHEDTQPGSPDTHRGPHPPDTGHTPGVSEPCRAHIRTPKKPRRFSGDGRSQPGVGVLGTAVAYRPASVKTLHADGSFSGYRCQHKRTPARNALNRWQKYITTTLYVTVQYNPHVCIRLV